MGGVECLFLCCFVDIVDDDVCVLVFDFVVEVLIVGCDGLIMGLVFDEKDVVVVCVVFVVCVFEDCLEEVVGYMCEFVGWVDLIILGVDCFVGVDVVCCVLIVVGDILFLGVLCVVEL